MTDLIELVAECEARGIRLLPAADGALTIDAPEAALTADLLDRLKVHKAELLVCLQMWGNCRPADGRRLESVDTNELEPCTQCGSLELWQTVAGTWRCQHCDRDVLERSWKLAEQAARLRRGERVPPLRPRRTTTAEQTPATTAERHIEKVRPELQGRLFEGVSRGLKGRKGTVGEVLERGLPATKTGNFERRSLECNA